MAYFYFLRFFEIPGKGTRLGWAFHGDISQATKWARVGFIRWMYTIYHEEGNKNDNAEIFFGGLVWLKRVLSRGCDFLTYYT